MLQSHHHPKRRGESEEKLHSENLRVPNGPMLTLSPQSKPNIVVIKPSSTYYLPQVESAKSTSSPLCLRYPPTPYSFFLSSSYPPSPSRVYLVNSTPNTKVSGHNSPPTTALGSILPEPPKPKCAYSCPQRDGANGVLIAKVNALGYEQGYSIFECVYVLPLFRSSNSDETKHC